MWRNQRPKLGTRIFHITFITDWVSERNLAGSVGNQYDRQEICVEKWPLAWNVQSVMQVGSHRGNIWIDIADVRRIRLAGWLYEITGWKVCKLPAKCNKFVSETSLWGNYAFMKYGLFFLYTSDISSWRRGSFHFVWLVLQM